MTLQLFESAHIALDDDDRDSWCTPQEVVDALLRMWPDGVDLDPCSNSRSIVPARTRWSKADDGLSREWFGRCYCNPPYSEPAGWLAKCASGEAQQVIGCIKADPSVRWWNAHVWEAVAICFPDHRVPFIAPPCVANADRALTSITFASALPLWCSRSHPLRAEWLLKFQDAFSSLGKVVLL